MSRSIPDTPADSVEDYLDRLLVTLSGSPRQVRHTLAEVEAHLRDAVDEGVAAGLPEDQAQAQALETGTLEAGAIPGLPPGPDRRPVSPARVAPGAALRGPGRAG